MNETVKKMITELKERFKLKSDESMVLFCTLLAKLYFIKKLDKRYEERIDYLITQQISSEVPYFKVDKQFLQKLEKNIENILEKQSIDMVISIYEKVIDREFRKLYGKFYTPLPLVEHILDSINLKKNLDGKIIDLSCGSGIFLSACVRKIIENSSQLNEDLLNKITNQIYGIDKDRNACSLTKLNLLIATFPIWKRLIDDWGKAKIDFKIYSENSLKILKVLTILGDEKFAFVIGNPPFVEAKKLLEKYKTTARKNFPEVAKGAFDIYVCFIELGLKLLKENGRLGYVLPNKFQVTKYAFHIRKKILENYQLVEICDISNLDYFKGTDVYPILLTVKNKNPDSRMRVKCNIKSKDIFESNKFNFVKLKQETYKLLENLPFYCFENDLDKEIFFKILERIKRKLNDFLHLRTTVSFHFKGLREKYVSKNIESPNKFKYLGGVSYARKNEIDSFKVEWKGYFINYDNKALKKVKNPLPPISNFTRPKIIFCQHAKRMLAYCDIKGEWVTKDVYPIIFMKSKKNEIKRIYYYTGFLNSNIFSYLYGIIYRGIQISEGYFHFLPSYMAVVPTPDEDNPIINEVSKIAKKIQENINRKEQLKEINKIFYGTFGLSKKEIRRVEEYNRKYLRK